MDGILEELLRLEGVKNRALIDLDPAAYEDSVQKQIGLINDPGISEAARTGKETLAAISKLSNFNTSLFENLLPTAKSRTWPRICTSCGRFATTSPSPGLPQTVLNFLTHSLY